MSVLALSTGVENRPDRVDIPTDASEKSFAHAEAVRDNPPGFRYIAECLPAASLALQMHFDYREAVKLQCLGQPSALGRIEAFWARWAQSLEWRSLSEAK